MQQNTVLATEPDATPAFTIMFRDLRVQCDTVAHVVEAVKALSPLELGDPVEREVPVPMHADAAKLDVAHASPVATAIYDMFREAPQWRRPIDIVKALKRRRIAGAKYASVYAVLRYGDFVKREGKWNLKDAEATG